MAILFVSPRSQQKTLQAGIIIFLVAVLMVISLVVFLPELLNFNKDVTLQPSLGLQYSGPELAVDLSILDSQKVKNLESFSAIETLFLYVVKDSAGKEIKGTLMAINREQAQERLSQAQLTVVSLTEANIGRSNPFAHY